LKSYTKKYLDFALENYNRDPHEILCEIPGCNKKAVDIHHILGKGKYPELKDDINNLIALCREHHEEFGQKKQFIEYLQKIINER